MFLLLFVAFIASMFAFFQPLMDKGEVFNLEGLLGVLVPSQFLYGASFIQDQAIIAMGVVLLAILGLLIYRECTEGAVEPKQMFGKKKKDDTSITKQHIKKNGGRSAETGTRRDDTDDVMANSFEHVIPHSQPGSRDKRYHIEDDGEPVIPHSHPGSCDQRDLIQDDGKPVMPHSHSSSLSPSPNGDQPAADPIPNKDGQYLETVTKDGIRVSKSIVDIIDLLTLRITSLEDQLYELEVGPVVEQPQQPDEPSQAMVRPYYPPDEEKRGHLQGVFVFEPLLGNWVPLEVTLNQPPGENEDPGLGYYVICVGVSLTVGIAAYQVLGRHW